MSVVSGQRIGSEGVQELGTQRGNPICGARMVVGFCLATRGGAIDEAYHYTFSKAISSIKSEGLKAGTYATPTGSLSPLQAQIDLALSPNRGLTDAVLRMDLAGLRQAGAQIPEITQVGRSFNMPGGGYEMLFPYSIPPEFILVIKP